MGYEKDSLEGILISVEILNETSKESQKLAKSNKGKQAGRRAATPMRRRYGRK